MATTNTSKMHGVSRILAKLHTSIENGNYYEAHQMYRTLYFRYLNQKRYDELLELLYDGATLLFSHSQHQSATDLAILMVDVLNKSNAQVTESILEKLANLFSLTAPETVERSMFLNASLKFSGKDEYERGRMGGHPDLHKRLAAALWREKNYCMARFHFLHSMDGDGCAAMLVEYHVNKGYPREVDLFIAQVVLQYLCLRNKSTATVVFWSYTRHHPDISEGPPFLLPLLNFLWFLLISIESKKLAVFTVVCEKYEPSLRRDPAYSDYLQRIGQLFFGLPPQRQQMRGNMLGNLLQSLFADPDSSCDEETGTASMQIEDLD